MRNKAVIRKYLLFQSHLGSLFFFLFSLLFSNLSFAEQSLDITSSVKYAALVVDSNSGRILYSKNADKLRHPASLAKTMSLFLTFEALESGKLTMNQKLYVSERAAMQPRSKLGLKAGERISVRDCIYALIIKSANDASVVLAEAIAGNEWNFVQKMNKKAKELGMTKTHFVNAHGWHDPRQVSTAIDMVKLTMALMHHYPKYYPLFSKTSFYYRSKIVKGHNHVINRYHGAEGLKTGYIKASGYNLVTTATRPHGRLIAVVFGGQTAKARDDHMINLLNHGFTLLAQRRIPKNNQMVSSAYNASLLPFKQQEQPTNTDIFSILDQVETKVANLDNPIESNHIARKAIYQTKSITKQHIKRSYQYKQSKRKNSKLAKRPTLNKK